MPYKLNRLQILLHHLTISFGRPLGIPPIPYHKPTFHRCWALHVLARWQLMLAYARTHSHIPRPGAVLPPSFARACSAWATSSTGVISKSALSPIIHWVSPSSPLIPLSPTRPCNPRSERWSPSQHLKVARRSATMRQATGPSILQTSFRFCALTLRSSLTLLVTTRRSWLFRRHCRSSGWISPRSTSISRVASGSHGASRKVSLSCRRLSAKTSGDMQSFTIGNCSFAAACMYCPAI